MNYRILALEKLQRRPYFDVLIKKVNLKEVLSVCQKYEHLGHQEFAGAIIMHYLDNPNKPANWPSIEEVLLAMNNIGYKIEHCEKCKGKGLVENADPSSFIYEEIYCKACD